MLSARREWEPPTRWALVPPFVAILLAVLLRRPVIALFLGVVSAGWIVRYLDGASPLEALSAALEGMAGDAPLAELLLRRPDLRRIVGRVQAARAAPYSEIHDNLIGAACTPTDMLRCKLSFFGATKFDPKSDRWTRITLYQGAPTAREIGAAGADDWAFPVLAP